jgi:thioredoxin 1
MSEVILNDNNFKSEIEDFEGVALVDFWAPWCGPCRIQDPIISELAQDLAGQDNIKIAKLNVDEAQAIAQRFSVRSIPTLMFFKNGQPVDQYVGVNQKNGLQKKLEELTK